MWCLTQTYLIFQQRWSIVLLHFSLKIIRLFGSQLSRISFCCSTCTVRLSDPWKAFRAKENVPWNDDSYFLHVTNIAQQHLCAWITSLGHQHGWRNFPGSNTSARILCIVYIFYTFCQHMIGKFFCYLSPLCDSVRDTKLPRGKFSSDFPSVGGWRKFPYSVCLHDGCSHFSAVRVDSWKKFSWKFSLSFLFECSVEIKKGKNFRNKKDSEDKVRIYWKGFLKAFPVKNFKSENQRRWKHFPQTIFCISSTFNILHVSVRDLNLSRFIKTQEFAGIFRALRDFSLISLIFLWVLQSCETQLISISFRHKWAAL